MLTPNEKGAVATAFKGVDKATHAIRIYGG